MNNRNDSDLSGADSLGRAANRYVTFQIVSAIIGGIIFLILLFTVFLPQFNRMNQSVPPMQQSMPAGPGGPAASTLTINGRPATPDEQRAFDQQIHNATPPGATR